MRAARRTFPSLPGPDTIVLDLRNSARRGDVMTRPACAAALPARSQRAPRVLISACQAFAPLLLLALTWTEVHAQTGGAAESSAPLLELLYLVMVRPLLPLLAGAGLFMLTRSHLVAAGLTALAFGAWGAWSYAHISVDGP